MYPPKEKMYMLWTLFVFVAGYLVRHFWHDDIKYIGKKITSKK